MEIRVTAFEWGGSDGASIAAHIGIGLAFCALVACVVKCYVTRCGTRSPRETEPLLNQHFVVQVNDEGRDTPYTTVALDALSPPPNEFEQAVAREKEAHKMHKATAEARLDSYLENVGKDEFTPTPVPNIPILHSPPTLAPTGYQQ